MTRTTPAQFPARQSTARRTSQGGVTYLGQHHRQPQAKVIALRHPAHPFEGAAGRSGLSLTDAARASLEAVRLFWQRRAAESRLGRDRLSRRN